MIMPFLWNIRSVKTRKTFCTVQMLNKVYTFLFIALIEPFQNARKINKYRERSGMPFANANCNGKILMFAKEDYKVNILINTERQLTIKTYDAHLQKEFYATTVYAKYDKVQRLNLWKDLYQLFNSMNLSWIIGGYFNVVLNEDEKIGKIPIQPTDTKDVEIFVILYNLSEVNYRDSPFTWCNGRAVEHHIFGRLDSLLVNQDMKR